MNKNTNFNLLDYFSIILVLSYFFINNIIIVIAGVILSIYALNKEVCHKVAISLSNLRRLIGNKIEIPAKNDKVYEVKKGIDNITQYSLAERIEELGFIPSADKNNNDYPA